jgi:catechol 2,3-dioxygenase-like lactoylglutathione lyase family enzyme
LTAGAARPSVATGPNAFEITNDRVFGPGGEALARRFARRVLAFDEVHWLGFDPDRATATLNFRLANGDPGMLLTRLAGAVAPCAAEVKEIELRPEPALVVVIDFGRARLDILGDLVITLRQATEHIR